MLKELLKKNKGYTVVEMIIVFAMMIIVFGVFFVNYKNNSSQFALQRAAYKLLGDIRKAQGMAGLEYSGCVGNPGYKNGYGINFDKIVDKNGYTLFADCDGNYKYKSADDEEELVKMEKGVEISGLSWGGNPNKVDLVFLPPDPFTLIGIDELEPPRDKLNRTLEITIRLESDTSKTKKISINSIGMISIQ